MTRRFFISWAMILISLQLFAQKAEVFSNAEGAIRGYDAVAYFTESKPVKGKTDFSYQWNNATWYFSSAENLNKFKATPEKYAPQFGGYCAYGLSEGHKSPTQPDAWTIVDNKLYLNYNVKVKEKWSENKEERIKKANENWVDLKDKE
ncbi:YHS domain-containing (seleno)protein [Emticicia sp. BO119]|uniref:YHS domain-containing (seleno)protein n=1 Tax=Emticicia sp. BO119 TaxID=2757768 RepID=UPI001E611978|nr:YHS domain-containing (seleno)protein [Emticicia sp. BO119]